MIGNDGKRVEPHILASVAGKPYREPDAIPVVRPETAQTVMDCMTAVIQSDEGTGAALRIPGYALAGKTGTAQKPGPNGYIPGAYVATFVGMVPALHPRLVVLVSVDQPQGGIYGGIVAAPAFEQIASFDLQYLEVPPDLKIK